jgi:hypothetical protein
LLHCAAAHPQQGKPTIDLICKSKINATCRNSQTEEVEQPNNLQKENIWKDFLNFKTS